MQYRHEAGLNAHTVGATQDKYAAFISESFGICLFRGKSRNHYKQPEVFCRNPEDEHKTFAEHYECLPRKARNSRRLTQAIVNTSIHMSSIVASKTLKQGTVDVGKSTICRLLKKERKNRTGD